MVTKVNLGPLTQTVHRAAIAENRSASNMVQTLVKEALQARAAQQRQGERR